MAHLRDQPRQPRNDRAFRRRYITPAGRGGEDAPARPHRLALQRHHRRGAVVPGEDGGIDRGGKRDARGQGVITSSVVV